MRPRREPPDGPLEPPERPGPRAWCDRCSRWAPCPCGCGWGWCSEARDFTGPDPGEECDAFSGEWSEGEIYGDDPRTDMAREEGWN